MKQKLAEFINLVFGFRKFLLMLAICLIAVIFRIKGLIDGSDMVDLLKTTSLGFFGSNGVEHIVTCIKEYNAGKASQGAQDDIVPTEDQEAADAKAGAT